MPDTAYADPTADRRTQASPFGNMGEMTEMMFNPVAMQSAVLNTMTSYWQTATQDARDFTEAAMAPDTYMNNPDALRAAFHRSAERQLRMWEGTADMVQAMPAATRWPAKTASRAMTSFFDTLHRRTAEPDLELDLGDTA